MKNTTRYKEAINNAVINSTEYICIATDETGIIRFFNRAASSKLGYKALEVVNKLMIIDLVDKDKLNSRIGDIHSSFKTNVKEGFPALVFMADQGIEDLFTMTFIDKHDNQIDADLCVKRHLDQQGKVVTYSFIGTKNYQKNYSGFLYKEIENRLINNIDNATGLFVADQNGKLITANNAFFELSGYAREEIIRNTRKEQIYPNSIDQVTRSTQDIFQFGFANWEVNFITKKGMERDWTIDGIKIYDNRYLGIVHDISDQKMIINELVNHQKLLRSSNEEAEKAKKTAELANKTKSEFIANISHEIKNPMNAILGFADLLYRELENEKQLKMLDAIRNSGNTLMVILNDILDISKIEAGKMNLEYEPVLLNNILFHIENMFSEKIKQKGLAFCVERDPDDSLELIIDEVRLRQILINLISNAIKFTDNGHICIALHMENLSDNRINITFIVEDTGIGINGKDQKLIFDTFHQAKGQSAKKYGGTGLGLSITKQLVEMMGGTISVISEVGTGSIFKIYLPNVRIKRKNNVDLSFNKSKNRTNRFENEKVLIVDDSELNINLILMILDNSNLELLTAKNGQEAIESARLNQPDLILMDLRMPVLDGYQATQIMKKDPQLSSIPIIAISAEIDFLKEDNNLAIFNDHLFKPIKFLDLLKLLRKYLTNNKFETPHFNGDKAEGTELITEEQKNRLREITDKLETDFLPVNEDLIKQQRIDLIDVFGRNLIAYGESFHLPIISDYGRKICGYIDNFELDLMITALKSFPLLIEKLKSLS